MSSLLHNPEAYWNSLGAAQPVVQTLEGHGVAPAFNEAPRADVVSFTAKRPSGPQFG